MDPELVAQVRRFNRIVTQRVGALNDRFLSRDRSLGEARVLWEIGAQDSDVRSLRTQLDLDSGYLSRLLRSLEAAGLVTVGAKASDRRVRVAALTSAGSAERAVLDRRADELASSVLEPLGAAQRERLVAAMAEVGRLLTASMVEVESVDPADPRARRCHRAYFAELNGRFDAGYDPALGLPADDDELRPPAGLLLLASLHGEPVGSGALMFHDDGGYAHLRRMWVAPSVRGLGVGRRLLTELESRAADHGARATRLETNKALEEAINLYRSAGYVEVAPFNDEAYANHWFEKPITSASAQLDKEVIHPTKRY
jgi:DNA-binding MarR family transcriptional regulator/GNAT superfamily N-acetyltransferase